MMHDIIVKWKVQELWGTLESPCIRGFSGCDDFESMMVAVLNLPFY